MMKFTWHSPKAEADLQHSGPGKSCNDIPVPYSSTLIVPSQSLNGVVFAVRRISLGMRMELMRRIREISRKIEFLTAGDELQERIEANLLAHEIDATYLRWGLTEVRGLQIDGEAATAELLIERGPGALTREIVGVIKSQCGLNEEERKN
jgi:hypothetical protein